MLDKTRDKPNAFADAPAAVAKRFGVSAKALRVYERMGLIRPARTQSGWRAYGRAEIERLAAIVALKQLGLPLKRSRRSLAAAPTSPRCWRCSKRRLKTRRPRPKRRWPSSSGRARVWPTNMLCPRTNSQT
jgi:DNA-binding transcriptional MerR regulator